tara:strand:+ start:50 stop:355 length:306 start_codon:yes stop_codon:yes gene_type:complete
MRIITPFLASVALLTGLAYQEQGSLSYYTFLVIIICFHQMLGVKDGRWQEREIRKQCQKEVRPLQESIQKMHELSQLCDEIDLRFNRGPIIPKTTSTTNKG